MTSDVEILARHGIVNSGAVVSIARSLDLDVALAATLLEKESGGGANVWGRDPVETAGAYVKGGPVTRTNYTAYRAARARKACGQQGCGPTQLTMDAYQLQADAAGGCWDWAANVRTGLGILAGLIRHAGERDGFRRYNGSGPAAEAYGADAMTKAARWRGLLVGATTQQTTTSTGDDVALTDDEIERIARRTADLTITRPTKNAFGDVVGFDQIVAGAEKRVADLQQAVAGALVGSPSVAGVSADTLAAAVVDRLLLILAKGRG